MTAKQTPEKTPDMEVILPTPTDFEVEGIPVVVNRLRSREFLTLMRVLTKGLGPGIANIRFNGDDPDEMKGQFIGLFVLAIPAAIDEFGQFLLTIVQPKDGAQRGALTKAMQNPEFDVLIDVITIVLEQEKDDLFSLVGKARAALSKIQSLYSVGG